MGKARGMENFNSLDETERGGFGMGLATPRRIKVSSYRNAYAPKLFQP